MAELITAPPVPASLARTRAPSRPPLRLGLVQEAWHPDPAEHETALADGIASAASAGAAIVCLQELTLSRYFAITDEGPSAVGATPESIDDGPTVTFARRCAAASGVYVHASLFERADDVDGLGFNTAIVVAPDGMLVQRTRKLHIPVTAGYYEDHYFRPGPAGPDPFPVLELPLAVDRAAGGVRPPVGGVRAPVGGVRAPAGGVRPPVGGVRPPVGGVRPPVGGVRSPEKNVGGGGDPASIARLGLPTCWDQWFPELARAYSLAGAEVLIYPTAIGSEPDHPEFDTQPLWQQVIVGNGIANGMFMVAVNRIGVEGPLTFYGSSFISDPYGRVLVQAPRASPAVLVADLDLDQRGDWLELFPFLTTRRPDAYGSLAD